MQQPEERKTEVSGSCPHFLPGGVVLPVLAVLFIMQCRGGIVLDRMEGRETGGPRLGVRMEGRSPKQISQIICRERRMRVMEEAK